MSLPDLSQAQGLLGKIDMNELKDKIGSIKTADLPVASNNGQANLTDSGSNNQIDNNKLNSSIADGSEITGAKDNQTLSGNTLVNNMPVTNNLTTNLTTNLTNNLNVNNAVNNEVAATVINNTVINNNIMIPAPDVQLTDAHILPLMAEAKTVLGGHPLDSSNVMEVSAKLYSKTSSMKDIPPRLRGTAVSTALQNVNQQQDTSDEKKQALQAEINNVSPRVTNVLDDVKHGFINLKSNKSCCMIL